MNESDILEATYQQFIELKELVNPLLVSYIIHKEFENKGIDHKFKIGYYNDYDMEQSYKYLWIECNDVIYDMTSYINDSLLGVLPVHRDNAYLNHTGKNIKNIYTNKPVFHRVDLDTQLEKDYDDIVDHLYTLIISDNDVYLDGMPNKYKKILSK